MAKYLIDTKAGTCRPLSADYFLSNSVGCNLLALMEPYLGTKEYDGIVEDIQKWYYGRLIKAPWCSTCMSYFLNAAGLSVKDENVYGLFLKAKTSGKGSIIMGAPAELCKGDIVFLCYSGVMSTTASKHVTVCTEDTLVSASGSFTGRGGNQDDMLCDKTFSCKNIYAVWRV